MDNLKEENSLLDEQFEEFEEDTDTPSVRPVRQSEGRRRTAGPKRKTATHKPKVKYIKPRKGNRIAISLIFTFLIVGVSAISSIGIIFLMKEMFGIDKSAASYTVKVPEEATVDDVIKLMTVDQEIKKKEPIIKVEPMFRLLVKVKQDRAEKNESEFEFVSGEHKLSPNMGYSDILKELTSHTYVEKETVKITIPEGMNIREVAALLEENEVCAATTFIYNFNKGIDTGYDFVTHVPRASANDLRFDRFEGYLFPDTYEFYKATGDVSELEQEDYEIIIRKLYDNFEEKYTPEFDERAKELGMTMDQVITLASIVQAEAADSHDMKNVASVFHNRLNNTDVFPTLGSDPTREYSKYVVHEYSDPKNEMMETAYNTYKSAGLPPGPICNPGIDAITAVLWPNETNYYYFCANIETKEVYYASTMEEHEYNLELAGITDY